MSPAVALAYHIFSFEATLLFSIVSSWNPRFPISFAFLFPDNTALAGHSEQAVFKSVGKQIFPADISFFCAIRGIFRLFPTYFFRIMLFRRQTAGFPGFSVKFSRNVLQLPAACWSGIVRLDTR